MIDDYLGMDEGRFSSDLAKRPHHWCPLKFTFPPDNLLAVEIKWQVLNEDLRPNIGLERLGFVSELPQTTVKDIRHALTEAMS